MAPAAILQEWRLMLSDVTVGRDALGFEPFPMISFTFYHIALPPSRFSASQSAGVELLNFTSHSDRDSLRFFGIAPSERVGCTD